MTFSRWWLDASCPLADLVAADMARAGHAHASVATGSTGWQTWARLFAAAVVVCLIACRVALGQGQAARSLETLLRETDNAAPSGEATSTALQARELDDLLVGIVKARNELVTRDGGLFHAIACTAREETEYMMRLNLLQAARTNMTQATARFSQEQRATAMLGQETLGYAAARNALQLCEGSLREANDAVRAKELALAGLYARLRRDVPLFFHAYTRLRQCLPHERGPVNATIATTLVRLAESSPEFADGYVVIAVALAYEGKDQEAASWLEKANAVFQRCTPLFASTIAEDCCAAWLLLGKSEKVGRFVAAISKTHAKQRTAAQEWLLGAHSLARHQHSEATPMLLAAVGKAGAQAPPAMIGQAALSLLLGDDRDRQRRKARDLLERVAECDDWPVLQGRAALAATENRWADAVDLLKRCRTKIPPCLEPEVIAQQKSYEDEKLWRRQ